MTLDDPFYFGLLVGAVFSLVLVGAGGFLTQMSPWYYGLRKPAWKPPDWAFGPIWGVILTLVALSIAYAWEGADAVAQQKIVFALIANGILNIAWSGIFFTLQKPALALAELLLFWVSILAMIVVFSSVSRTASRLLLPYLAWVTVAGVLNFSIVRLNRR